MKLEKDGIVKEIEKNLVSDYIAAGWKILDKPKQKKESKTKTASKVEVEEKDEE